MVNNRELVAGAFAVLAILLLTVISVDRGIPATLESLAFVIHKVCAWVSHHSMTKLCGLADRMRRRRDQIELENEKRRVEIERVAIQ